MNLDVFNEREQSTQKIIFSGKTVQDLLQQLQINSETVLVTRDNEVLTSEEVLREKDRVEILSVISGG